MKQRVLSTHAELPGGGLARLAAGVHVGSATEATRAAMVDLAVDNLLEVLSGRPARTPLPGTAAVPR